VAAAGCKSLIVLFFGSFNINDAHQLPAFITVRERGRWTLKVERTTALGATMAAMAAADG
jgi:hypothetical protein